MNGKLKRSVSALLLSAMLPAVTMVQASGIPTFDGAAAASALQQIFHWKARFENVVRDKMTQIPGVKQFIDSKRESEIEAMFQRRIAQCGRMRKSNPTSSDLCINTVKLERQKYVLLKHMNAEITSEFNRINDRISSQGKFTSGGGAFSQLIGAQGSAGKAESAENDVQAQLQGVLVKIQHYEAQLAALDQSINQLKWARKQLTKDLLAGDGSAGSKIAGTGILQGQASDYRNKAANLRQKSTSISNRF